MTFIPRTLCNKLGCHQVVEAPAKYCDKHRTTQAYVTRDYNKGRSSTIEAFYQSREWKMTKKVVLARDHNLCQPCLKKKSIRKANTVHHIIEVRDDWSKRVDFDNLESICTECHNAHHKKTKTKTSSIKVGGAIIKF